MRLSSAALLRLIMVQFWRLWWNSRTLRPVGREAAQTVGVFLRFTVRFSPTIDYP